LYPEGLNGVSSTHDVNLATREIAIDRNHNNTVIQFMLNKRKLIVFEKQFVILA